MQQNTFNSTQSFANYEDSTVREECRICLQQLQHCLQSFCECRGNHKGVHERCLREWALRAQKHRDTHGNIYFYCELCRTPIYICMEKQCHLRSWTEICKEFEDDCCRLVTLIMVFLIFLGVVGLCISTLAKSNNDLAIYTTLMGVAGLIAAFTFLLIVIRLLVRFHQVIQGFLPANQVNRSGVVANSYVGSEN